MEINIRYCLIRKKKIQNEIFDMIFTKFSVHFLILNRNKNGNNVLFFLCCSLSASEDTLIVSVRSIHVPAFSRPLLFKQDFFRSILFFPSFFFRRISAPSNILIYMYSRLITVVVFFCLHI